jgi:hypothetical protein
MREARYPIALCKIEVFAPVSGQNALAFFGTRALNQSLLDDRSTDILFGIFIFV